MADREYNRLRETSLGEDLYTYLLKRQRLPQINRVPYITEGTVGEYNRESNIIKLLNNAQGSTLTHEAAHAADGALSNQYWDRPTSWSRPDTPTYFTDAYEKLKGETANNRYQGQRENLAQRLDPAWFHRNKDYRSTNNELVGWGAGRQAGIDSSYTPPDHLDSTIATELSILMDLAKRKDVPFVKKKFNLMDLFK